MPDEPTLPPGLLRRAMTEKLEQLQELVQQLPEEPPDPDDALPPAEDP